MNEELIEAVEADSLTLDIKEIQKAISKILLDETKLNNVSLVDEHDGLGEIHNEMQTWINDLDCLISGIESLTEKEEDKDGYPSYEEQVRSDYYSNCM